ncbi:MAG: hypothetical protein ACOX34_08730 [Bacillota bacterium]|nr:hypothetical protein [Candidatus Fermentithermobacillaceae bacterium]
MSRFLRVGVFLDRLEDIAEAANLLSEAVKSSEDINSAKAIELAEDIESMAKELLNVITRWNCEPLIYTGGGTTEEVITLLDTLLKDAEKREKRLE